MRGDWQRDNGATLISHFQYSIYPSILSALSLSHFGKDKIAKTVYVFGVDALGTSAALIPKLVFLRDEAGGTFATCKQV